MPNKWALAILVVLQIIIFGCKHPDRQITWSLHDRYRVKITSFYDSLDDNEKFYCEMFDGKGAILMPKQKVLSTKYNQFHLGQLRAIIEDSVLIVRLDKQDLARCDLRQQQVK